MSIPSDPSVSIIVAEGLRRGGIINPTGPQLSQAIEHAFREVKSDIALLSATHPTLRTISMTPCVVGQSRYNLPTDAHTIRGLYLVDGPDDMRGTAQAGANTTVTLASTFDKPLLDVQGKLILMLSGTSSGQYRQVTNYDNTTKIATVDTAWTTNPVSGDTYVVATNNRRLWPIEEVDYWQLAHVSWWSSTSWSPTAPTGAMLQGREVWLNYPPDRRYGLMFNYYADLDRLDETGTVFTRCLRDWRTIWIYGVAAKSMEGYDLDKASLKFGPKFPSLTQLQNTYQSLLQALGGQSATVTQVNYVDL